MVTPNGDYHYRLHHLKGDLMAFSDHLLNHVQLASFGVSRNQMHRNSPILADRALMRDLIVLQRSRSLRDPSMSPPSWLSPSIPVGHDGVRKTRRDGSICAGRRSLDVDRHSSRLSMSLPLEGASNLAPKVANSQAVSDHNACVLLMDAETNKGVKSSKKIQRSNLSAGGEPKLKNVEARCGDTHGVLLKTLSEQLDNVQEELENNEGRNLRHVRQNIRCLSENKMLAGSPQEFSRNRCTGPTRAKKHRHRIGRRILSMKKSDVGCKDQCAVSNSILGSMHPSHFDQEGQNGDSELEVARAPRNGCGIPWNWSRIHRRGRSLLDFAGRRLSCGISYSMKGIEEGSHPQNMEDASNILVNCNHLNSSTNSDPESLPLLTGTIGSHESNDNQPSTTEYSGELGIYADHNLKHKHEFDLLSEANSGYHYSSKESPHNRHRPLTQKYMPKTFRDLVGQNLVAQALSNAVLRRKVGLIYVFYGPHGTGKTSCARLFAKALNCLSFDHPKPCDVCPSCNSQNLGTSKNVLEVRPPVNNFTLECGINDLSKPTLSIPLSHYRVFIVDDCHTLSSDSWAAVINFLDQAPRKVVFVFISTNLDLPHIIMSRCQKFFFPKIKDSEIIRTLQWIATNEGFEIEKDALKLIATRSNGSLRDAEMTLDQLSLLAQRISINLVQEFVGLVSDEKLVDLLDMALSADTVNTVKSIRDIVESGVDPLALMSQLAAIITDILGGSYVFTQERLRKKFFCKQTLSKDDMERLRQALKTLSESEKQLRMSDDKVTWLKAALLQLAPDHQYLVSSNYPEAVLNCGGIHSLRSSTDGRGLLRNKTAGFSRGGGQEHFSSRGVDNVFYGNNRMESSYTTDDRLASATSPQVPVPAIGAEIPGKGKRLSKSRDIEKIWKAVLDKLQPHKLKQVISREGKLMSVSLGPVPSVQLLLSSNVDKSKVEKFRGQILQAFESVFCSTVMLEILCESENGVTPVDLAASQYGMPVITKGGPITISGAMDPKARDYVRRLSKGKFVRERVSEQTKFPHIDLVEEADENGKMSFFPGDNEHIEATNIRQPGRRSGSGWLCDGSPLQCDDNLVSPCKGKAEAGQLQNTKGFIQQVPWSKCKAASVAGKLEEENLRLEPRSRSTLFSRASGISRGKFRLWRARTRKLLSIFDLIKCGRCLSTKSSR